jgi:cell division protease FtsH
LNPFYKNLALWLVITLMMVMLYNLFNQQQLAQNDISYSEFLAMVEADRVAEVTIQGQEIRVTDLNRSHFKIYAPQDPALIQRLKDKGRHHHRQTTDRIALVHVGAGFLVSHDCAHRCVDLFHAPDAKRRRQGHVLWQKPGRLLSDQQEKVTFEDVAGIDEAKEELEEIVAFL